MFPEGAKRIFKKCKGRKKYFDLSGYKTWFKGSINTFPISLPLYLVITFIRLAMRINFCPCRADSFVPASCSKEQALTLIAQSPISLSWRIFGIKYQVVIHTTAAIVLFSRGASAFFCIWTKEQAMTLFAQSPISLSGRIWSI